MVTGTLKKFGFSKFLVQVNILSQWPITVCLKVAVRISAVLQIYQCVKYCVPYLHKIIEWLGVAASYGLLMNNRLLKYEAQSWDTNEQWVADAYKHQPYDADEQWVADAYEH
ncbi:hypothetical protein Tco_0747097 [Tanacetum coccineum]